MTGEKLQPYRSKIRGTKIIITDLQPNKEKDIPVIFAAGWGATCLFYERMFLALRDSGRRVIGVEGFGDARNTPPEWPEVEARRAAAILRVVEYLNISRADLLGQSAGAFPVTLAAVLLPARFRNFVLVTPAGFIGPVSFSKIMFHWLTNNLRDPSTRPVLAKNSAMAPAIIKNIFSDFGASCAEVKAILKFPLDPFIPEIRRHGIKVAVIYGENDTIIPKKLLLPRVAHADLIMPMAGPHGSLILLPHGSEKVLETFSHLANMKE